MNTSEAAAEPLGGSGTSFESAQAAFQSGATAISKKNNFNQPCNQDFAAVGTNAGAVQSAASKAVFLDGVGSTVTMASLYASSPVPGVAQAGSTLTGSVGDYIASHTGTVAASQLGGHDIYLNAALIDPNSYWTNISVVLHELLHNVTGLTDNSIQGKLGLPESNITDNITQKLLKDCF